MGRRKGSKDLKPRRISGRYGASPLYIWDGYPILDVRTRNRGPIFWHVLVMEKNLGRPLQKHERIHHIDGNLMNFAEENLLLTNNSDHAKRHRLGFDIGSKR